MYVYVNVYVLIMIMIEFEAAAATEGFDPELEGRGGACTYTHACARIIANGLGTSKKLVDVQRHSRSINIGWL